MSRHLENKEEKLLKEYFLLNDSIQWWESEVNDALDKIDSLEEKELFSRVDAEEAGQCMKKLKTLLGRCKIEKNNMDNLESKIFNFLNQKKIIKNAPDR